MKNALLLFLLPIVFAAKSQQINFNGKAILALSDADISASTFTDGKLLQEKGSKDQFSVIRLPVERGAEEIKSVIASNSEVNGTKSLVLSLNQKIAYVVESRGAVPDNATEIKNIATELPTGAYVTVVDIADLSHPKLLYKFPTPHNPTALDIDKSGQYLAISSEEYGKEVQVLELDAAGKPIRIINKPQNLPSGKVSDVSWDPDGEYLAVTLEDARSVSLVKVLRDGPTTKIVRLEMIGRPIRVGNYPGSGQFTPDGNYYVVPDLKKGNDASNESNYDGKGEMYLMKFNKSGTAEHALLSRVKVGENIGGFAISPDGKYVVVASANKSTLAWNAPNFSPQSMLSHLKITDGKIEKIADYNFMGLLPQSVIYDKNGENIAVSIFEYPNYGKHFGSIDFWKIIRGNTLVLQLQDIKFFVPRGCHALKLVN